MSKVMTIKLRYHRHSKQMGKEFGIDSRLWDVLEPKLEGYNYDCGAPVTLGLRSLLIKGLLNVKAK